MNHQDLQSEDPPKIGRDLDRHPFCELKGSESRGTSKGVDYCLNKETINTIRGIHDAENTYSRMISFRKVKDTEQLAAFGINTQAMLVVAWRRNTLSRLSNQWMRRSLRYCEFARNIRNEL